MMTYDQSIEYIHSFLTFGMKLGLERINALSKELGNPQDDMKFIHVAGTNGKGSVCTMIAKTLECAGYKTGLYTSPYVVDFCERIQINSEMIPHDDLSALVKKIKPAVDKLTEKDLQPTEFELITAAAILYFKQKKCDVVVLETGLGGRYDATNVVASPLISVLTSISYDHMAVLGDTLSKIASEKCGIIKGNGITVSYPKQSEEVIEVIKEAVKEKNNKLIIPKTDSLTVKKSDIYGTDIIYDDLKIKIPLQGNHQIYNAITAVETLKSLKEFGINLTNDEIEKGISETRIPARMEILKKDPLIIMDGGHNEDCANALYDVISKNLKGKKINAVIGMMADKDVDAYLKKVVPLFENVFTATPCNPRAMEAKELEKMAEKYCKNSIACSSPKEAFDKALNACDKDDALIICGSFYLASEIRKYIFE